MRITKRIKTVAIVSVLVLVGSFIAGAAIFGNVKKVPNDFLQARQNIAFIAKEIVVLSDQTAKNIEAISILDRDGKYDEALNLVTREISKNQEARVKAISLSSEVQKMTNSIPDLRPAPLQSLALEALNNKVSLINRLITYNGHLYDLLSVLQNKLLGKTDGDKIPELIAKINDEARAISELNDKFNDLMRQFDES